jgi:hypothetical protein
MAIAPAEATLTGERRRSWRRMAAPRRSASAAKSDRDGAAAGRLRVGVHHAGIVYILVRSRWCSSRSAAVDFLTDTQWTPLFDDAHFGIMVLLAGTLTSSVVALLVAIPLGTIIAIYLSEFAGHKTRETLKPCSNAVGRADHHLRLLRAAGRHAAAAEDLSRACPASTCCRPGW